jgi:toxin ParE1/3/4
VAQLRISTRASEDLLDIWSYIADDSEANADGFIDKIYETMELLARQPGLGCHREELAPGIQSFAVGRYIVSIE